MTLCNGGKKREEKKEEKESWRRFDSPSFFFFFLLSLDLPLPPRATENEVAGYSRTNFNRAKSS